MAHGGAAGSLAADRAPFDRMWWLAIGGAVAMLVGLALTWTSLPDRVAVQWSTGGDVTNTMSKIAWALLWMGAWVLVSSSLVALRAPLDWRRMLVIAILGILAAGYITTLENNIGAASASDAEQLDLLPAAVLAVVATTVVWVTARLLDR